MKSIYRDENWLELQEKKEGGEGICYIYEEENGKIIYPFIKRKAGEIDKEIYYDLVTARGEAGPILIGNEKEKLVSHFNQEFQKYCQENNIIAEYIRFDPWEDTSYFFKEEYNVNFHGNLYCFDLQEDFFTNQFSSSKRRAIRKAEKSGMKIEFDFTGETVDQFIKLYNFTENKYQVSSYYVLEEEFIKKYFIKLKEKAFFIHAYFEEKLISSCLILLGEDIAHYHFSANDPAYKQWQANTYLLYKSMVYAQEKGKKLFDLGGATSGSALENYKLDFIHKTPKCIFPYQVGTKIRNQSIYDALVEKAGELKEGYFPAYRR